MGEGPVPTGRSGRATAPPVGDESREGAPQRRPPPRDLEGLVPETGIPAILSETYQREPEGEKAEAHQAAPEQPPPGPPGQRKHEQKGAEDRGRGEHHVRRDAPGDAS